MCKVRKAVGLDGISSKLLKSCAGQLQLQLKPEAEEGTRAVEHIWLGTSAEDSPPEGLQQLQASGTVIAADGDPGEAGPWSPSTTGETIDGPAAVFFSHRNRGACGWSLAHSKQGKSSEWQNVALPCC